MELHIVVAGAADDTVASSTRRLLASADGVERPATEMSGSEPDLTVSVVLAVALRAPLLTVTPMR